MKQLTALGQTCRGHRLPHDPRGHSLNPPAVNTSISMTQPSAVCFTDELQRDAHMLSVHVQQQWLVEVTLTRLHTKTHAKISFRN